MAVASAGKFPFREEFWESWNRVSKISLYQRLWHDLHIYHCGIFRTNSVILTGILLK